MLFFYVILAMGVGAFVGKFMEYVLHELPPILLSENRGQKEPRDVLKGFYRAPFAPSQRKNYFLVIGMAVLYGITVLAFSASLASIFVLIISSLLICCFFTDFEHGILPDQLTLSILWIGLLGSLSPIFVTPKEAIIGAILGYGIFWLINELYRLLRGFDGMFPGDFKLNAGLGACFGIKMLLPVLILSLLLIIFVAIGKMIWYRKLPDSQELHKEVAYSCYVSIVAILALYLKLSSLH